MERGAMPQATTPTHMSAPPVGDRLAALAGLVVLRWAAWQEAEQEAVAAFDETPFSPFLPSALRRPAWAALGTGTGTGTDASEAVVLAGVRELAEGGPGRGGRIGGYASAVAPVVVAGAARGIADLAAWAAALDFGTVPGRAAAADAFEDVLAKARETGGRDGGQFVTPDPVADLMVRLLDPQPGDRVYDPCFGHGGALLRAVRGLRAAEAEAAREGPAGARGRTRARAPGNAFGVEIDRGAFSIGLCRLVLAGEDQPGLELGDALERPLPRNPASEGFDRIVASPPWGARTSGPGPRQYPVPNAGIETLFLQHVMASLRPGGRAVVALPEGALFRTGGERQVRKALLDDYRVEAVVALPEGAFAPCTGIPASLLVFSRAKPAGRVRFVQVAGPRSPDEVVAAVREGGPAAWSWDASVDDLARRDHELVARRPAGVELDSALQRLRAADPTLPVVALRDIGELFRGVSYDRKTAIGRREAGVDAIGLLRVGDFAPTGARAPELALTSEATRNVRDDQRLRAGDLVVTLSGSVGRIGVISEVAGTEGCIASKSIAVVRLRSEMHPSFFAALLRSPAYQGWMTGHARGVTIQHLSLRTLASLPMPSPPIAVQEAVLRRAGPETDTLSLLVHVATEGTADPLAAWAERPGVVALSAERTNGLDAIRALAAFARELAHLRELRNRIAHGIHEVPTGVAPDLESWVLVAASLGDLLADIDSIPSGAARLSVLVQAQAAALSVQRLLEPDGSALALRLASVTNALFELIEPAIQDVLRHEKVAVEADPKSVVVGVPTEVRLTLRNDGGAGLRSLRVTTDPRAGELALPFLAEGASAQVPLTLTATGADPTLRVEVTWTATRLDGTPVRGRDVVDLLVRTTRDAVMSGDLGPSPYIVGSPVERDEMLYGRSGIIDRIRRQLGPTASANVVLLEGNRRTGKTSILKYLRKKDVLPGWIPVYCSFQDAEGDESRAGISTRNIYRLLARTIGWEIHDAGFDTWFPGEALPAAGRPFKLQFRDALDRAFAGDHPFETFEGYLAAATEAAQPRRILLMLDEFDKLQDGIDSGLTSPQVPENLRHLLQHCRGVSAILTGSRRLKRMREEYWSVLFGLGHPIGISALPTEDARRLVTEPVANRLSYLPQARDRVVDLCAAQPFLVQSLCNRVFEMAAVSGERTITLAHVEDAAAGMVRDNEHLRTLWDYAGTHRRRLVLALCDRLSDDPDPVGLDLLSARLEMLGVPTPRKSRLGDDLDELRELELLEFDRSYRGGTYRIAVPLFGLWLRTAIDVEEAAARAREEALEEVA